MDNVKKFCDHSMILLEMAGDLLTNGLKQPPPPQVLGLTDINFVDLLGNVYLLMMYNQTIHYGEGVEGVEGVKGMKFVSYQDVLQEKIFEQEVENTNALNFFNISF